ncbi:MAG: RNA polymerase sigma factor [Cytophagaceae bacterium]|nr:RNA polymerase sigma factor [Cytophagaceae bacterium]MBL0327521.1 RNA polymerase sigma factor [Cytophagaceae bacterium]
MQVNLITEKSFSEASLEHILNACILKNEYAQNELYKLYFGYAKSVAMRYSSNVDDAKDILMKGFLKVFNNLESFDQEFSFKAWLRTIIINTALSHYRDNKKFNLDISLENYNHIIIDENIIDKISSEEIMVLVQKLPPAYRTVFGMYAVDGYSHKEISETLNINEGTSRSNFSKARQKLQYMIQASHPELFQSYSRHNTKILE